MRPICLHTDVGAMRPGGASPLDRKAEARFMPQGDDITGELEENLERLTLDIPDANIDDLPTRYLRDLRREYQADSAGYYAGWLEQ